MDFASVLSKSDPHQRTIIHLDMDYYYAQVEEIRNPELRTQPLGVLQKSCVVTSNYIARLQGVTKLMLVDDAKRLCPSLVLVNGEDLTPYRQMSLRIHDLLLNYTPAVEKLGLDENYLDVSNLVASREISGSGVGEPFEVVGNIWPPDDTRLDACPCGCATRLAIGSRIAQEIRTDLENQLGITCCAGVAYNKLLAKLVGAQNKPNQQTVLVSSHSEEFMRHLSSLNRITGVGQKTESLLLECGVANVTELQNCDMEWLRKKCGFETATKLKDLAFGRDTSTVRASGRPKSISLEDSCRPISVRHDVEDRFRVLLLRLMEQVALDGRIPIAIKVVLRKFDTMKKTSHRETKQANILPSLFRTTDTDDSSGASKVSLADGAQDKLLKIIMRLFERVVDMTKPFNITLIGLAFSKFQQRKATGSSSIANFLIKKTDLEVQSITSLTNTSMSADVESGEATFRSSPTTFQPSDQFYRRRTTTASPIPMLVDNGAESAATNSDFSDFSETEVEPSPKKSRISRILMSKRHCLGGNLALCGTGNEMAVDVASPSKLRVCDLRLNSRDSEKDGSGSTTSSSSNASCTSNASPSSAFAKAVMRFRAIKSPPSTLISPLASCGGTSTLAISSILRQSYSANSSPLESPMDDSMSVASSLADTPITLESPLQTALEINDVEDDEPCDDMSSNATNDVPSIVADALVAIAVTTTTSSESDAGTTTATTTINSSNLTNIPYPKSVDRQVFNELPLDVQNELILSWRNSLAAVVASASTNTTAAAVAAQQQSTKSQTAAAAKTGAVGPQKNTLYRYFLRHK